MKVPFLFKKQKSNLQSLISLEDIENNGAVIKLNYQDLASLKGGDGEECDEDSEIDPTQ
jgi:hypothetical protein